MLDELLLEGEIGGIRLPLQRVPPAVCGVTAIGLFLPLVVSTMILQTMPEIKNEEPGSISKAA